LSPHYDDSILKNNPSEPEIRKSLRFSLWDAASWSLTVGFAEMFLAPYAIFLGAANVAVGLLATLPQVIGDLCQLGTSALVRFAGSRKRLILWGIAGQAIFLALAALLPLWPGQRLAGLMLFSILYWSCWMAITPAWQSWMGDLVPPSERGLYFGLRSRLIQIVTFASLVAGGGVLFLFQGKDASRGFWIILGLGVLGRLLSLAFIGRQTDVPDSESSGARFSFGDFLQNLHRTNFGRFVLYVSLFAAAVNISGSYFVPFVLEELGLGYGAFMAFLAILFGVKFLTIPVWGRLSDRYGSRKVLALSCIFFCLPPLLLTVSRNFWFLTGVQVVGGIAIGGFELCTFNFLLDNTAPEHRTRAAAYYQVLTGIGIIAGALCGGLILKYAPFGWNPFAVAFLVSGILRVLLSLGLLPRIREVRDVPHVTYRQLIGHLVRFQKSVVE
jgi:MFS family permease